MARVTLPESVPFDYQYLIQVLKDYSSPRNKISLMLKNKEMIRIKKGLYVASLEKADPFVLACLIYGPSYVSMESALSHLGLIPERVDVVTCMTSKRNKHFVTPAGRFSYTYLHVSAFSTGVDLVSGKSGGFFIATPEKALCDRVSLARSLRRRDMESFLAEELRIELEGLKLDAGRLKDIGKHYRNRSVQSFIGWYFASRKGR